MSNRINKISDKIINSQLLYPARPEQILKTAKKIARQPKKIAKKAGLTNSSNALYLRWLENESMLKSANKIAKEYSGHRQMWQKPFGNSKPRRAVRMASTWYTSYPISMISKKGDSTIKALADDGLWQAFEEIGINAVHTGPMKIAGGVDGWEYTPSIDGHFDRISNKIDDLFGDEKEYRELSKTAKKHNGIVIDDLVPGHTGKGSDFRLAEMAYKDYPGIYHMIEIEKDDWNLLPKVPKGETSINIDPNCEKKLKEAGYIIGKMQRVIFYEKGIKETNWSVTKPVRGTDGTSRRWVYLHYFKEGQPTVNWVDPSFAGMKLVIGDALHSIGHLGSSGLRLDANGFLGVERDDEDAVAWSEGHPMSKAANQIIASTVRKVGGFTFQELSLSADVIKSMSEHGADLSYDFINRPAVHHALATGDAEFLRLTLNIPHQFGIDPASLVHALQNHDELTTELVHFLGANKDKEFHFRGGNITGDELRSVVKSELNEVALSKKVKYNAEFGENGIACTTTSFVASCLGIKDPYSMSEAQLDDVKKLHLLLVQFNAMQPGVFALSGWDLAGSLTLSPDKIKSLLADGDTRWLNRGAYDLMDNRPKSGESQWSGMPKADSLYGSLPEQLSDDNSFVANLKRILKIREHYDIAMSYQVDIPEVDNNGLVIMVHKLDRADDFETYQVTALNFSSKTINSKVRSTHLPHNADVIDMFTDEYLTSVNAKGEFEIVLEPYRGTSYLISK